MIELFFVTCLLSDPERCNDHSLLFEGQNGLFSVFPFFLVTFTSLMLWMFTIRCVRISWTSNTRG